MKKSNVILLAIACFFAGVGLGFMISPAKQGFGHTTNYYYTNEKKEEQEKQEEQENS